MLTKHNTKDKL